MRGVCMKNKTIIPGIALMVMAMVFACARYDDESDFQADPADGGKSVRIAKYMGSKKVVRIPPHINQLPVTAIGDKAFREKNLTGITIPNSVTSIGDNAFYGNRLTRVIIPNSVTSIGEETFSDNQLTSVTISTSVSIIGYGAFTNNQLASVTIPAGVTTIGYGAFSNNQLTSVTIPASVISIGSGAFYGNQLTGITIPVGVISIGSGALGFNPKLTAINVSPENPNYSSTDGVLYNKDKTTVLQWPAGKSGEVTIPGSVTVIGEEAFAHSQLTSVTIPASVTSIENYAFSNNHLTSITIPASITSIGNYAFTNNQLTSITIPASVSSIGDRMVDNIGNLAVEYNRGGAGTYTRPSADSYTWVKK